MTERALLICAALSVAAHFVIARALEELPSRPKPKPPRRVTIQVVEVPRPPEQTPPEPAPEPASKPAPTPTRVATPRPPQPRSRPVKSTITATAPTNTVAPSTTAVTVESSVNDEPVYSATMQSTSGGGSTSGPVGSATGPGGTGTAPTGTPSGAADVVPAFETTKMPLPQGQCFGKYTDEARTSGVEGTVVLDLTVGEDGHTRDIRVMQGLPHGLSEAAVAALRDCKFSPGEKAGKRVPVRIRGFKIQFVLAEAR